MIALLISKEIKTQTHAGVRQMFGLHFIKTGLLDKSHGNLFSEIFDIWDGCSHQASKRLLVIRKNGKNKKPEIRYALTNASLTKYAKSAVAYMQAQRFFIEHAFKEAKNVLGMSDFQTRKWQAWYHQIAMIMLLLYFIMKEKMINFDKFPLISAWDMRELLMILFMIELRPRDVLAKIMERHKKRQYDINRYYRTT